MKKFYIFFVLVIFMGILSCIVFNTFNTTKLKIKHDIFNDTLTNVKFVAKHISIYIDKNFDIEKLKKDKKLKQKVDEYLNSFITPNYKNIFILYPKGKFFIALADGSNTDRFDFKEKFEPLNKEKWNKVLVTKKAIHFKQSIQDIWTTFLYPVLKNNNIEYILVIDFSTKPVSLVDKSLDILKSNVKVFIIAILISIIVLIIFIIYDYKRQKYMESLILKLQELNNRLEEKVKEELEKNRQKDKQLELQSRMALMGELLSMIAHQWRQPLNAISAIVSNLKLDIMLGELNKNNLSQTLEKMENMILHLSTTIDDFRKFYREENSYKRIFISKVIKDTLNIVLPSLKTHSIEIKTKIEDYELYTMPNRLKQVLLNIIKNASDVLRERGVKNPTIFIKTFKEENNYIIEIKDNGGGIKKNIIDKIFEPYFTTKDEKNGTGLGLYMSKTIIKKLNGEIFVYNDENGAIFRIELKEVNGD